MTFAQPFQNQFAVIQKHDMFKIKSPSSGSKNSEYFDRCHVIFSVAHIPVEWFILLDQTQPTLPPDFIFINNAGFNPKWPSYWDIRDSNSLHSMLVDLRNQFLFYQKESIKKIGNSSITFELETLENIPESEFCYLPDQGLVYISLPLTMLVDPTSIIVPSLNDIPLLRIQFNLKSSNFTRNSQIYFPPTWPSNFPSKITDYPKFDADLTIDYLSILSTFWENKLKFIHYNQQFLELFKNAYKDSVVESSSNSIQFLFSHGEATALIKLELSNDFPNSPPIIIIMPFSKDVNEKQKDFKRIDDMPWSPRWKADEILSKFKTARDEYEKDNGVVGYKLVIID